MHLRKVVPGLVAVLALGLGACNDESGDAETEPMDDSATSQESEAPMNDDMDGEMDGDGEMDDGDMSDDSGDMGDESDDMGDAGDMQDGDMSDGDAMVPASLNFTAQTLDGEKFNGATLAGKPTVLWFWAPWCPVCAGQADSVAELAQSHAGELNVVGVARMDDPAAMADFVAEHDLNDVTQLSDGAGKVWRTFEVTEQSSFVVLDADGEERYRQGYREPDELAAHVEQVLR